MSNSTRRKFIHQIAVGSFAGSALFGSGRVFASASGRKMTIDLNDAPAGIPVDEQMDLSRELPCATGVIDVDQFLNALEKIGYDGPVRAEPFNKRLNQMANNDLKVATTARAMKAAFALIR